MSWASKSFETLFEPTNDGYVFHRRRGGVRVSAEEVERWTSNYRKIWGIRRRLRDMTIAFVVVIVWAVAGVSIQPLDEEVWIPVVLVVAILTYPVTKAFIVPYLETRNRELIAPPRSRRAKRALGLMTIPWWFIVLFTIGSGGLAFLYLTNFEPTLRWWLWTIGSSSLCVGYIWIAVQKFRLCR